MKPRTGDGPLEATMEVTSTDLGLGAWFGGSLMGAIGVSGDFSETSAVLQRMRDLAVQ